MDTTFSKTYDCEELAEIRRSPQWHRTIITPAAPPWADGTAFLLTFILSTVNVGSGLSPFGRIAPNGASGIFATPDPQRICVVAKGEGLFCSASEPRCWEPVRATPVIDVLAPWAPGNHRFCHVHGLGCLWSGRHQVANEAVMG